MKLVKLLSMTMICMAIVLVSCSGEDGERGPQGTAGEQGPAGADGIDGEDGSNGVDGIDGNANVQSTRINMDAWNGGSFFEFNIPIAGQDRPNFAFLFYLEYALDTQVLAIHSVPGATIDGDFNVDVNFLADLDEDPNAIIYFRDHQGASFQVPPGLYFNLIIIAIEISNLEGKNGTTDMMAQLKAAGVDTNDYNAVAAYFGLD